MTWSDIPGDDPTNAAMIKRDEPAAAPVAAGEDPLQYVRDAIYTALEATRINGATPQAMEERIGYVVGEVRKLVAQQNMPGPSQAQIDAALVDCIMSGVGVYETRALTVEHVPGDRWSVR